MDFDFGALPFPCSLSIGDWTITDLPDQSVTLKEWAALGQSKELVFPPLTSEGGASQVWGLPATHRLTYSGSLYKDRQVLMMGLASFVIYVVGAIAGAQVQHDGWLITGRQSKSTMGFFGWTNDHDLEPGLAQAVRWFEHAPPKTQRSIVGTLFLHNRIPYYNWDWERFAWQYTVIDAAWRAAGATGLIPAERTKHSERLERIRSGFGLLGDDGQFQIWVDARNDLLHEALWGTSIPGHDPGLIAHSYLPMRGFGTLAVLAACGIKGAFLQSNWHSRSRHRFHV